MYDMPDEIKIEADGPLRIITLNRPASLNAVNDALHTGLARLWPRLAADYDARCAVLTGAGRAFCAGGDVAYLEELSRDQGSAPRPSRTAATWSLAWPAAGCRSSPRSTARRSASGAAWWRCQTSSTCTAMKAVNTWRRPARPDRPRRGRRRTAHLAAAHQPAAGEGVRAHRRPHPRRAGTGDGPGQATWPTTRWRTPWPARSGMAALPRQAAESTKAHTQPPPGTRRPGHADRLRDDLGRGLIRHGRLQDPRSRG